MLPSKRCSDCKEIRPLSQFHKRRASPDGLAYRCVDCVKTALVQWRADNPGAFKAWSEKNPRDEYRREWYAKNREGQPERYAAWARANPDKKNALIAKRRAAQLNATPPWADLNAIQAFYTEAARLTKETGIRHEVDHIVPLQGDQVCGLHHEGNLQILTRSENARKRNKFTRDALELTA